jgi:hypothetical protein
MVSTWGKTKSCMSLGIVVWSYIMWRSDYLTISTSHWCGKLLFLKHLSIPQYRDFHWWFNNIGFIGDCSFWRKLWNFFLTTFFNHLSWIETKMKSNVVNYKGVHQFIKPHCNLSLIIAKGLKVFRFPTRNLWKWKSYF